MTTAGWTLLSIGGGTAVVVAASILHAIYRVINKANMLENMLNTNVQVLNTIQVYLADNSKEHGQLTQEFLKVQSEFRQLKSEFDRLNHRMDAFDKFQSRIEQWCAKIEDWLRPQI